MRNNLFLVFLVAIIAMVSSCVPDSTKNPVQKKIKQSIKINDDNINGINLRVLNHTIIENANFYYNTTGLLDSFDVFSDTLSSATLYKSLKLKYYSDKIRAFAYDTSGRVALDFYFNSKHQITSVIDTFGLGYGFYFTYTNDRITNIKINLGAPTYFNNFIYDGNNNLLEYTVTDTDSLPLTRVNIEYDLNSIPNDIDIKFVSAGIRFLYAGGVNVFGLAGLNYGLGNTHRIIKRSEYNIQTAQPGFYYTIGYTTNNNQEITDRKIVVNDTIDVFYHYRYQ